MIMNIIIILSRADILLTWDEIELLEKKLTFDLITQSPLFSPIINLNIGTFIEI